MNVFRKELRMATPSFVAWVIAFAAVSIMFVSIFPAFSHDVDMSRKLIENFPSQVRAALGLSLNTFVTFLGFYAYALTYLALAGAVQATNLGITMLNREALSGTTDFLLTRPISRKRVFFGKLAAALTVLVATNIILVITVFVGAKIIRTGNVDMNVFFLLLGSFLLLQLMFLSIGIAISQFAGRIRSVIATSLSVCFGFFAVSLLASLTNDKVLRYLTPFQYFNHLSIVTTKSYEAPFVVLAAAVIIVPIGVGAALYFRRDARSSV